MSWNTIVIVGLAVAFAVCAFGAIYSLFKVSHIEGETDEDMYERVKRNRVMLNPHFIAYAFFAIVIGLVLGYFSWLFK
jgi:hypothetical protein